MSRIRQKGTRVVPVLPRGRHATRLVTETDLNPRVIIVVPPPELIILSIGGEAAAPNHDQVALDLGKLRKTSMRSLIMRYGREWVDEAIVKAGL